MKTLWQTEPVAILAIVQAGIALAIGFGAHISSQQTALILALAAAVLGAITRTQVSPK